MYCTFHTSGVFRRVVGVEAPKFLLVGHTLGPWQRDSCMLVSLEWGVSVCESLFLIFILGVPTNHFLCIRCDWSPMCLISFRLPN